MPIEYNDLSTDLKNRVRTALVNKGKTLYVHASNGNNASSGRSWNTAFLTMQKAFDALSSGDTIVFAGKVREQLVTPPLVFDVTVIGAGNRPRHADDSPVPVGGKSAATWAAPASPTAATPLCKVQQQGWRFENITFAGPVDNSNLSAAIQLSRTAEGANERDASHASFYNCRFASGHVGINDTNGTAGVRIEDCFFEATGRDAEGVIAGDGGWSILGVGDIGVGQTDWVIKDSRFIGFGNGVKIAGNKCLITRNYFSDGETPATTVVLNTVNASAGNNFIVRNYFQTATANFNDPDVEGNTTDVWMENYTIDSTSAGVGSNFEAGKPA